MAKVEHITNGTNNLVEIVLYSDGVPVDMTNVTRVVIEVDDVGGSTIDSSSVSMDWSTSRDIDGQTAYPITFEGDAAGLAAGVYRDCWVRIYDSGNAQGLVWPEPLSLVVE